MIAGRGIVFLLLFNSTCAPLASNYYSFCMHCIAPFFILLFYYFQTLIFRPRDLFLS